ncbi:FAD-binding oxidoreductase [Adhaeribacter aquaticus]|uniref:FAD-binding oxidoreductase n=1 Tax=Adhaeribacter aquaticus TaxID=299567 RepID=UPI0004162F5F|nr:FAD-linked oxidase C-terminal domain-containing protein [Adhaeribacter aquaticus]
MTYNAVSPNVLAQFKSILEEQYIINAEKEEFQQYCQDQTEDLVFYPEIVLKPGSADEISQIMKICNEHQIAVTPRGAGTGLSGGALPVHQGVIISTERLNKIIEIDERNFQSTVEPGVINQVFQEAVKERGLFYPPDPASKGSCFLGGNLSLSAGGPKAVKYGVTKDYVLNIQVVLPSGEIIWTGANVLKNATGYNLTQLMIGSEGTLGIITKIVFRLIPFPAHTIVLLVPFRKEEEACAAVSKIMMAGIVPSGLEFMEREAILWSANYLKISMVVPDDIQAHLLIELDGNNLERLYQEAEHVYEVVGQFNIGEVLLADSEAQKNELWKIRRNIGNALRASTVCKDEDTVVPRAELPALLKGVKEIGNRYNFKTVCLGHAGDGNLHVNVIKGDMSDFDWQNTVPKGIHEIFELCVKLGGTISGEHGIGFVQRPFIGIALSDIHINLMRGIKQVFDPKGILNPGKIF